MQADAPNEDLHSFKGNMQFEDDGKNIPLSMEQLLLSGAVLKNSKYAIGLVVYNGFDSKIMQNSKKGGKIKQSRIEAKLNRMTIVILLIQVVICVMLTLLGARFNKSLNEENMFSEISPTDSLETVKNFTRYF